MLITDTQTLQKFTAAKRLWQGIPSIEKTKGGRLFAAFYSGGIKEEFGNYCAVLKSEDDGMTWSEPIAVAYNGEKSRCFDECLWIDPRGRLWFTWNVMPQFAVYASVCDDPDAAELVWSRPFIVGKDVMMNKPTVLSSGEWLFPIAVWANNITVLPNVRSKGRKRLAFAYKTNDEGKTFVRLGGVDMPERCFDEHMILERESGTLAMYVRTFYGIGVSYSYDAGLSWTPGTDSGLGGPCSRFFIRKLKSGNVLLVNHVDFSGRNNLTALLSRNGGKTFEGGLLLDERSEVSYPDGTEDGDGYIYVTYDRERGCFQRNLAGNQKCARELLFAKFTEEDVLAGKIVSRGGRLKQIINKLGKYSGEDRNPYRECKYYTAEEYADVLWELGDADHILSRLFKDYSSCCNMLTQEQNRTVDEKITEMMREETPASKKRGLLLDVIRIFRGNAESAEQSHVLVESIIEYVGAHFTENLSVERIADYFNVSVYYLCHLFKNYTNTSLVQFINSRRIAFAKKLLRDSGKNMTEVCYAAGFGDASYFTKQFKKSEGVSPGKYKKMIASETSEKQEEKS